MYRCLKHAGPQRWKDPRLHRLCLESSPDPAPRSTRPSRPSLRGALFGNRPAALPPQKPPSPGRAECCNLPGDSQATPVNGFKFLVLGGRPPRDSAPGDASRRFFLEPLVSARPRRRKGGLARTFSSQESAAATTTALRGGGAVPPTLLRKGPPGRPEARKKASANCLPPGPLTTREGVAQRQPKPRHCDETAADPGPLVAPTLLRKGPPGNSMGPWFQFAFRRRPCCRLPMCAEAALYGHAGSKRPWGLNPGSRLQPDAAAPWVRA